MSESGIRYELLEGLTIDGVFPCTSDIIFVFLDNEKYKVDNNVVGYLFSADEIIDNPESYTDTLNEMVRAFEKRNFL